MCEKCRSSIENDLAVLKNQNDGRTIHEVQNMRHVGQFLLKMLDTPMTLNQATREKICYEAGRLHEKVITFYKKQYPSKSY